MYPLLGFAHATASHFLDKAHRRLRSESGQGTVEYIGLILLLAGVMIAVVKTGGNGDIATSIVDKVKATIKDVGDARKD